MIKSEDVGRLAVEHMPSIHSALGLIPCTEKRRRRRSKTNKKEEREKDKDKDKNKEKREMITDFTKTVEFVY